ncbi:hypothetical protein TK50_23810 [Micromonospora haikouensis]|uniref:Uncharacterized protein n=1 Tax=Micromonospora haikouensis TaxID=686309 RepID=A0A0D0VJ97_9ACTN|nr:hypothetical protein TK50_23810 [Micromonospora haikouensis]
MRRGRLVIGRVAPFMIGQDEQEVDEEPPGSYWYVPLEVSHHERVQLFGMLGRTEDGAPIVTSQVPLVVALLLP